MLADAIVTRLGEGLGRLRLGTRLLGGIIILEPVHSSFASLNLFTLFICCLSYYIQIPPLVHLLAYLVNILQSYYNIYIFI